MAIAARPHLSWRVCLPGSARLASPDPCPRRPVVEGKPAAANRAFAFVAVSTTVVIAKRRERGAASLCMRVGSGVARFYFSSTTSVLLPERPHTVTSYMAEASAGMATNRPLRTARA